MGSQNGNKVLNKLKYNSAANNMKTDAKTARRKLLVGHFPNSEGAAPNSEGAVGRRVAVGWGRGDSRRARVWRGRAARVWRGRAARVWRGPAGAGLAGGAGLARAARARGSAGAAARLGREWDASRTGVGRAWGGGDVRAGDELAGKLVLPLTTCPI